MPSPTASATCLLTACILTVLVHPASAQMEDSQTAGPPVSADAAFAHYCAPCHGDDGRGKGSKTFGLSNPPPDLTQLTVRNGGTFPRERLARLIDGREDITAHNIREMPIWGDWFKLEGEEAFAGVPEQETRIRKRIEELLDLLQSMQEPAK
jgi:mono/diheme cytochrome c family protein